MASSSYQDHFNAFSVLQINLMNDALTGIDTATEQIRCFKYTGSKDTSDLVPKTNIFMQWYLTGVGGNPMKGVLDAPLKPKTNNSAAKGQPGSEFGPFAIDYPNAEAADGTVKRIPRVALGYTVPTDILGWNLFNGLKLPTDANYKTVKDLTTLLTKNDPWTSPAGVKKAWKNAPGFYIFGSRQTYLGKADPGLMAKKPGFLGVVDEEPKKSLWSNPNSIVCLLVWRTDDSDYGKHRVSLYAGGDGEWQQEEPLINFMGSTVDRIKMAKAGHHGSRPSTSIQFVKKFQPEHWLYSAGRMHGHPASDLIMWLSAFYRDPAKVVSGPAKRFHAVCYPYLLARTIDTTWDQTEIDATCPVAEKNLRFLNVHDIR